MEADTDADKDADTDAAGSEREAARAAAITAAVERCSAIVNETDPVEARAALSAAAALLDRPGEFKRRIASRFLYAQWTVDDEPAEAVAACADVLQAWRADSDVEFERTGWAWCRDSIGGAIWRLNPADAAVAEPVLAAAERVVASASPETLQSMARLYQWRPVGDPHANWQRRLELLRRLAVAMRGDAAASAQLGNAIAVAESEEPALDAGRANDRRLAGHAAVLATLEPGTLLHVGTAIQLATVRLDRAVGDRADDAREAEALLLPALAASVALGAKREEAQAALLLGRLRAFATLPAGPETRREAVAWYEQGRRAAQALGERMLVASADKSLALVHLAALHRGEAASLAPLRTAVGEARDAFAAAPGYGGEVRVLDQIEAEACIAAGHPGDAVAPLEDAIDRVHADIAHATSRAGRLELAWGIRDSAALLAYCHAAAGDAQAACAALERGRGLYWMPPGGNDAASAGKARWSGSWRDIVPEGGAVVVPCFAGPQGVAVVATRPGAADSSRRAGDAGSGAGADAVLDIVLLPEAGADAMLTLVAGEASDQQLGGWLVAWCHRESDPGRFSAAVTATADALHRRIVAPIEACLTRRGVAQGAEVVWLPQGRSSALPIHVAAGAGISGDAGPAQECFVDRVALRYAPSLASLERATKRGREAAASNGRETAAAPPRSHAFVDPNGSLPFAHLEAHWLAESDPSVERLVGAEATAAALLDRLRGRPALLHVACHGSFDLDDPFHSVLVLAGEERLTLDTLLPHLAAGHAPALAVLSACQTATPRVTAWADELLGFPGALLANGVGGVVGSAWAVGDEVTALLMRVFHARRRALGGAGAMREAQRSLRDATAADLLALFAPLRELPGATGALAAMRFNRLAVLDADERPFAHPIHWAGFSLWGDCPADPA